MASLNLAVVSGAPLAVARSVVSRPAARGLPSMSFRSVRKAGSRLSVVPMAKGTGTKDATAQADETAAELTAKATEVVDNLKAKWDETEEKPAAVAIAFASFLTIWASAGLIDSINKLPVVGQFLELVGLFVTGWFVYRYLLFGPDREELKGNLDAFIKKVTGPK